MNPYGCLCVPGSASLALGLLGKVASPPSHSLGGYDDERTCHAVRKCSNGVCGVWINELIMIMIIYQVVADTTRMAIEHP